jgi:hypothetical protein
VATIRFILLIKEPALQVPFQYLLTVFPKIPSFRWFY